MTHSCFHLSLLKSELNMCYQPLRGIAGGLVSSDCIQEYANEELGRDAFSLFCR